MLHYHIAESISLLAFHCPEPRHFISPTHSRSPRVTLDHQPSSRPERRPSRLSPMTPLHGQRHRGHRRASYLGHDPIELADYEVRKGVVIFTEGGAVVVECGAPRSSSDGAGLNTKPPSAICRTPSKYWGFYPFFYLPTATILSCY